jgi:hypothetical protein
VRQKSGHPISRVTAFAVLGLPNLLAQIVWRSGFWGVYQLYIEVINAVAIHVVSVQELVVKGA